MPKLIRKEGYDTKLPCWLKGITVSIKMDKEIFLAPSLLACDFADPRRQLEALLHAGVKYLHLDVMDGVFVPNISFGQPVIASLRAAFPVGDSFIFDCHLMINEPHRYIEDFALSGADIITFHAEAEEDIERTISLIHEKGLKAGVSVKPKTPIEEIFHVLHLIDLVLVMSVEPGFGGQSFMPEMLEKVSRVKEEAHRRGLCIDIEIDGGIGISNAAQCVRAGANLLVAGSSVLGKKNPAEEAQKLLAAAKSGILERKPH